MLQVLLLHPCVSSPTFPFLSLTFAGPNLLVPIAVTYMDSRFGETVPGGHKGDFIKYVSQTNLTYLL